MKVVSREADKEGDVLKGVAPGQDLSQVPRGTLGWGWQLQLPPLGQGSGALRCHTHQSCLRATLKDYMSPGTLGT